MVSREGGEGGERSGGRRCVGVPARETGWERCKAERGASLHLFYYPTLLLLVVVVVTHGGADEVLIRVLDVGLELPQDLRDVGRVGEGGEDAELEGAAEGGVGGLDEEVGEEGAEHLRPLGGHGRDRRKHHVLDLAAVAADAHQRLACSREGGYTRSCEVGTSMCVCRGHGHGGVNLVVRHELVIYVCSMDWWWWSYRAVRPCPPSACRSSSAACRRPAPPRSCGS